MTTTTTHDHPAGDDCRPGCPTGFEPRPVSAILDGQGVLQPGDAGFWQHWGASARDIRVGDLLLVKWEDSVGEYVVAEVDHGNGIAPRVTTTDGRVIRVGGLQRITVLRQGTHNTLAR